MVSIGSLHGFLSEVRPPFMPALNEAHLLALSCDGHLFLLCWLHVFQSQQNTSAAVSGHVAVPHVTLLKRFFFFYGVF